MIYEQVFSTATCQQEESLVASFEDHVFFFGFLDFHLHFWKPPPSNTHGLKFKLSPILCMVVAIPPFMILGMGTAKLVSYCKGVCGNTQCRVLSPLNSKDMQGVHSSIQNLTTE